MEPRKNQIPSSQTIGADQESADCLTHMLQQDDVLANRVAGVKFVQVVLSSRGVVFDRDAIRQKVIQSYPDAVVFFQTPIGKSMGAIPPEKVDLLIDLTGPRERQGLFHAKKLRRMARVAVGRNSGFYRKKIYDRIYDEKANAGELPIETLQLERFVQKKVFNLAGVSFLQAGETPPDRGKTIALELPGMQRL